MLSVKLDDIYKTKSNLAYCKISNGEKFLISNRAARPWEKQKYSILKNAFIIYGFWVNEENIYIKNGDFKKAGILNTHSRLFNNRNQIIDIVLNNESKFIYEKGFVNVNISFDINQSNSSALYISRGENNISSTSFNTITGIADKLKYKVYKCGDPHGEGIKKSINDDAGYTKDGNFINYRDSGDLNEVAVYEPS